MIWRSLGAGIFLGAVLLGCGSSASPSPSVAPAPSAAASPVGSAGGIVLERTPPIGCDAIGVDYKSVTIKIDAASDPDVWAGTDAAEEARGQVDRWLHRDGRKPDHHPRPEGRGGRPRRDGDQRPERRISEAGRVLRLPRSQTRCTSWRPIRSSKWRWTANLGTILTVDELVLRPWQSGRCTRPARRLPGPGDRSLGDDPPAVPARRRRRVHRERDRDVA